MKRVRVKPSKEVSLVTMVGGIVMIVLGVIWVIPTFGAFGIVWTIFAVAITDYHALMPYRIEVSLIKTLMLKVSILLRRCQETKLPDCSVWKIYANET